MSDTASSTTIAALTAQIVSAHVANNDVPIDVLPDLIRQVHRALAGAGTASAAPAERTSGLTPAVSVNKSVFPDHIVCLEDGQRFSMLKRHLMSAHQMTLEQYRERWGLPTSYPMVAPKYAKTCSALAKSLGLGRKKGVSPGRKR